MERQLVIWCPGLLEEKEDGRAARAFAQVVDTARAYSPAVEAVRPGVCAMPARGPSRYFGGDSRLARLLRQDLDQNVAEVENGIGVADGLFAAVLAARAATSEPTPAGPDPAAVAMAVAVVVIPPGATPSFLSPWPVAVLDRPELADLLRRLGIRTLGDFGALPTRHVLGRLGTEGVVCREVASGTRSELPGYRLPGYRLPGPDASATERHGPPPQGGFWGEKAEAEARAAHAVARLEGLVAPDEVGVGRLQGGRDPGQQARLVPWAARKMRPGPGPTTRATPAEPWPGRLPSPAPARVLRQPVPAALVDAEGKEVEVTSAGLPTAGPQRLSVDGGLWQTVAGWAGPWPVDERWWAGAKRRRRRAVMQVVVGSGQAYLVVRQAARWWVEGAYD